MDNTLDDLVRIARQCELAGLVLDREPLSTMRDRLLKASETVGEGWSKSYVGYHAHVYIEDLTRPRIGEFFDITCGLERSSTNQTRGRWREFTYAEVEKEILRRAGVSDVDLINQAADNARDAFEEAREELLPIIDAIISTNDDSVLREIRKQISELQSFVGRQQFADVLTPRRTVITNDYRALNGGHSVALHLCFNCWLLERLSYVEQTKELAKLGRRVQRYMEQKYKMKGKSLAKVDGKIFIGHGRSSVWLKLAAFLRDRLQLEFEEFNQESAAGLSNKERLLAMLGNSCFALLIMTAEDEHADKTRHARENVIHEAGLFQGRLGFERAIILLEDGCQEFSNVHGIGQIRFTKDHIEHQFEEIRRVLEREKII